MKLPRNLHRYVLALAIIATLLVLCSGCASSGSGPQGTSTWTTFWTALAGILAAALVAPVDLLVGVVAGIVSALSLMAFSPKYPLNPPRTPDGHEVHDPKPPEKPLLDKTLWEVIHG